MKLTSLEKKMLIAVGVVLVLLIASVTSLSRSLHREFGDCKGLKGAVEKVWYGTECVPTGGDSR